MDVDSGLDPFDMDLYPCVGSSNSAVSTSNMEVDSGMAFEELEAEPESSAEPRLTRNSLSDVPYEKRWDMLKPVLEPLYVQDDHTFKRISEIMKEQYGFDAREPQYKYYFRKWKWKRNISKSVKTQICRTVQRRADYGKTASRIQKNGQEVDKRKIIRFVKSEIKQNKESLGLDGFVQPDRPLGFRGPSEYLRHALFVNWNLPSQLLHRTNSPRDILSPTSPHSSSSPGIVVVTTPPNLNPTSPTDALSPLTVVVNKRQLLQRTQLFLTGRHAALENALNANELNILSDWMYDYWFYLYKTAKHWGYGPKEWKAEILHQSKAANLKQPLGIADHEPERQLLPPSLCRWSVHVDDSAVYDEGLDDATKFDEDDMVPSDLHNPASWKPWSGNPNSISFPEKATQALEHHTFSHIDPQTIPIALGPVAKASSASQEMLSTDALYFAIMSGNAELTEDIAARSADEKYIDNFYPVHLAVAYLNGATTCCNIVSVLCRRFRLAAESIDNYGHGVLDVLMIRLLSCHSNIAPEKINRNMRGHQAFEGEAIDICGRWDHESECYQRLSIAERPTIPATWKHKFCHTSVQAICHCIVVLSYSVRELSKRPTELFGIRCTTCGANMRLGPLHLLIMVGYHLARSAANEEDLFGIIVVLSQMLQIGADARKQYDTDPSLLFGEDSIQEGSSCNHRDHTARELAMAVPPSHMETWSRSQRISWDLIKIILQLAEVAREKFKIAREEEEGFEAPYRFKHDIDRERFCENCCFEKWYGDDPYRASIMLRDSEEGRQLGVLHAMLQTEILTYRRQSEKDSWNSGRIDLEVIISQLKNGDISLGKLEVCGVKPICGCGNFVDQTGPICTAEQATSTYISNLGDQWPLLRAIAPPGKFENML